jgi:hypothetical protein
MKTLAPTLLICCFAMMGGCSMPKTFVRTMEPAWTSIELREDLAYDKAWASVVDILVKTTDLVVVSRDDGYVRTAWLYTWTGEFMQNYRVRITVKFSPDKKVCELKAEAEHGGPGRWVMGYDSRLLSTMKTDIMGAIGRTTR